MRPSENNLGSRLKDTTKNMIDLTAVGLIGATYVIAYLGNEVVSRGLERHYEAQGIPYNNIPADDEHMFRTVRRRYR